MDFKFNSTQIAHQTPVRVDADVPAMPVVPQRYDSEYAETAAQAINQPWSRLKCILNLLEPERWMSGSWGSVEGGLKDERTGFVLTVETAQALMDERIKELGLDAAKVHAYPEARGFFGSIASERAFWHGSFEARMTRFK